MLAGLIALLILPQNVDADMRYEFDRLYNRDPVVTQEVVIAPRPVAAQSFILPTGSALVSGWYYMDSRFPPGGPQHTGVDYACVLGQPIVAAASGTMMFATRNGDCGLEVAINHGGGVMTFYCHLSGFVTRGWVNQGDIIGYCGSTGLSTGPHLHYEKWSAGGPVNPTIGE